LVQALEALCDVAHGNSGVGDGTTPRIFQVTEDRPWPRLAQMAIWMSKNKKAQHKRRRVAFIGSEIFRVAAEAILKCVIDEQIVELRARKGKLIFISEGCFRQAIR